MYDVYRNNIKKMKIRIEAKKENLDRLMAFCQDFLLLECSLDYNSNLLLVAVEEVFTNIASYAFRGRKGYAELELVRINENTVRAAFKDDGCPFNPLEFASDDRAGENIDRLVPGGLGIYIVKNTMKNLQYEYTGGYNIFSFETQAEAVK